MRFDTFWTHPDIEYLAPSSLANAASQPPHVRKSLAWLRSATRASDDVGAPGLRQSLPHFTVEPHEPRPLIAARTVCRTFNACIEKLEVKDRNLGLGGVDDGRHRGHRQSD
jgi:hypothetical protein